MSKHSSKQCKKKFEEEINNKKANVNKKDTNVKREEMDTKKLNIPKNNKTRKKKSKIPNNIPPINNLNKMDLNRY